MKYVKWRNGKAYYYRRVPTLFAAYDKRKFVRVALNTYDPKEAQRLSILINANQEQQWRALKEANIIATGENEADIKKSIIALGFKARTTEDIVHTDINRVVARLQAVEQFNEKPEIATALVGDISTPTFLLSEALKLFWPLIEREFLDLTTDQIRIWKNTKARGVTTFISAVEDKPIGKITRDDLLAYQKWWINRVQKEGIKASTANKNLQSLKIILETVSTHYELGLPTDILFAKLALKEIEETDVQAFENDYVQQVLLNPSNLSGLNKEAKLLLYIFANTGAGISELIGLCPQKDIILDAPIPYIDIRPYPGRTLKKPSRKRQIPLVGCALWAMKQLPNGFERYQGRASALSSLLNKYLRDNGLMPTKKHTVYSLRHTFQDNLTRLKVIDRTQCELMGHKFDRPKYGQGTSLEQKQEILLKMAFQTPQ